MADPKTVTAAHRGGGDDRQGDVPAEDDTSNTSEPLTAQATTPLRLPTTWDEFARDDPKLSCCRFDQNVFDLVSPDSADAKFFIENPDLDFNVRVPGPHEIEGPVYRPPHSRALYVWLRVFLEPRSPTGHCVRLRSLFVGPAPKMDVRQ